MRTKLMIPLLLAAMMAEGESLATNDIGAGTSAGVPQAMNGNAYPESEARIQVAARVALQRINFKVAESRKTRVGELIRAKAENPDIEVELEALSPHTTRMQAVARNGFASAGSCGWRVAASRCARSS